MTGKKDKEDKIKTTEDIIAHFEYMSQRARERVLEAERDLRAYKTQLWALRNVPDWAEIGKKVRVKVVPDDIGRTAKIPVGTVGTVEKYERELIFVRFRLPLTDADDVRWYASEDRKYLAIGYKPDELEPYQRQKKASNNEQHTT